MNFKIIYGSILLCGLFFSACEDQGNPVTSPNNTPPVTSTDTVHFNIDVLPLLTGSKYACTSCHSGNATAHLNLDSYIGVLSGNSSLSTASASDHGPVVTPGNGEESIIVKKLRGTAGFGARMPYGSPNPMDEADIQKIVTWIDQGALNN